MIQASDLVAAIKQKTHLVIRPRRIVRHLCPKKFKMPSHAMSDFRRKLRIPFRIRHRADSAPWSENE